MTLDDLRSNRAKSGYVGVYHVPKKCRTRPYQVSLYNPHLRKMQHLGYYSTAEKAAARVVRAFQVWDRKPYTWAQRAKCKWGHPLTDGNRIVAQRNGKEESQCLRCSRERWARENARRKAERRMRREQQWKEAA